jgi:uncharacterized protein YlxP (DUF503 family)
MHIAILQFELHIDGAASLKDKRRVVRSLKDGLHKHHMVSVAEVGALETWNLAILGLVACNRSGAYLQQMMDNIIAKLSGREDCTLGECSLEIVSADMLTAGELDENGEPLWTEEERRDAEPAVHPEADEEAAS